MPELGDQKLSKSVLLMLGCLFIALFPAPSMGRTPAASPEIAEVELPYRLLVNSSKNEILLIGSAHDPLSGVTNLGASTREFISTASAVLFEALPGAKPGLARPPTVRQYIEKDTLKRLDQLSRSNPTSQLIWVFVVSVPLVPEQAATLFFWRCLGLGEIENIHLRTPEPKGKSADRLIMESLLPSINPIALETADELNSMRTEQTMRGSAKMVEEALVSSLKSDICISYKSALELTPKFLKERRIRELYDGFQSFECEIFACFGLLNGISFSEARNKSLASKILRHSQGHRRVAVIVGALHLDERAGLMKELKDVGFHEIENNLVGEPRR